MEAIIELIGDAIGGRNRVSLEIHLEAVIVRVWRTLSCEFGDALGGSNRASLDEYWEAVDG